jgi:ADP-ribosylglycohydrolase
MRAGPLGVLYARDPLRLAAVVRDQALVTHRDSRSVAGAVAIAGAVALAATPGPLVAREALEQLSEWVFPFDRSVGEAVGSVAAWLAAGPAEAARGVAALAEPGRGTSAGVSPFVTPGVAWSLYAFLRSPDDYWETLCTAIAIGGDTDTLAAMAGAMGGARLGPGGLPAPMVEQLSDAGAWGASELAQLARDCAALPLAAG